MSNFEETLKNAIHKLEDAEIFTETYYTQEFANIHFLFVCIEGDWKHDHLYAQHILTENGFSFKGYSEYEDSGCDYYRATHKYVLKEDEDKFDRFSAIFA